MFTSRPLLWFAVLLPLLIFECAEAPTYPDEPVITYEGMSSNEIFQFPSGVRDTLRIFFSFTDGDGDLSRLDSNTNDVFLFDSRFPDSPTRLNFPDIEEEGTGNGISGDATIVIDNFALQLCCLRDDEICVQDQSFPVDQFRYSIQVRDRAGNFSNVIDTEEINLRCVQ
ncbi:MAG: hypothetical protein AAF433_11770 [Bacteroidota bacterium]